MGIQQQFTETLDKFRKDASNIYYSCKKQHNRRTFVADKEQTYICKLSMPNINILVRERDLDALLCSPFNFWIVSPTSTILERTSSKHAIGD